MRSALVCGAGGFIGHHLVRRLKQEGYWVRGVDLKRPLYEETMADDFVIYDLREKTYFTKIGYAPHHLDVGFADLFYLDENFNESVDEIYQLAADMGGAGFVFTGDNDADILHNSATINLNLVDSLKRLKKRPRIFYSSSACIYPEYRQLITEVSLSENDAYPAAPDSEYGWEKLFSERLYMAYARNYNYDIRIARFHNIFGPLGSWDNGREKAPAALCRKIASVEDGGKIEIWGDGTQTRTFLYIDECIEGIRRLMNSSCDEPVNIGSDYIISINGLAEIIASFDKKTFEMIYIDGPIGVIGRSSNNIFIENVLGWRPKERLIEGLEITYKWISGQIKKGKKDD